MSWCLILGGSSGTGGACARALAADPGLDIVALHRGNHPGEAKAVGDAVRAAGRRIHWHVADAGRVANIAEIVAALREVVGPGGIAMFLHGTADASVGDFTSGTERQLHPRQLQRTFESMAHSFVLWIQALRGAGLLAHDARMLAFTNPLTLAPLDGCGAIAAAKAALETYVRYLALELGPAGMRVNALNFGAADTTALRVASGEAELERLGPLLRESTPARRLVSVEEVAQFVSVLAGSAGAWFNGAVIDLTGGEALGHYDARVRAIRDGDD